MVRVIANAPEEKLIDHAADALAAAILLFKFREIEKNRALKNNTACHLTCGIINIF